MNQKGLALILVVSVLTVAAIMAVSFAFTMRMETKAAANYQYGVLAGYVAEAGIGHARAVLKSDKMSNGLDALDDSWRSVFQGQDVDNDGDGEPDSRWINVEGVGRYAVLVEDEAGKININTAGWHSESPLKAQDGWSTFEISLKDFLNANDIADADALTQNIINYRYGSDGHPGESGVDDDNSAVALRRDGIDNNADGFRDEPKEGLDDPFEFVPDYPYGDDRPFISVGELKGISGVDEETFTKVANAVTAYSRDKEISMDGQIRWNINSISVDTLVDVLMQSGVSDPYQKAVNIIDFADSDFAQTSVAKLVNSMQVSDRGPLGDWRWVEDHYECEYKGGAPLNWYLLVPFGEYYVFMFGDEPGQNVGDVTINGNTMARMDHGDLFISGGGDTVTVSEGGPFPGRGPVNIAIQHNEDEGICYFSRVELYPKFAVPGLAAVEIKGAEGIRINEIMVSPVIKLGTSSEQEPGGNWVWTGSFYQNSTPLGGREGEGVWEWSPIPDGNYYLTVYGTGSGQKVGTVEVNGAVQEHMNNGDLFTAEETVTVTNGRLTLNIQNNEETATCYLRSIELSQQPDGEYIEIVNITPEPVSVAGWTINGGGAEGWPATIPLGTPEIPSGGYLVLAVDKADSCSGIASNSISLEGIWGNLNAVQLDFSRSVTSQTDLLEDEPALGAGFVILRDAAGRIVDSSEYLPAQIKAYQSLEKGDPTYMADSNSNGMSDNWHDTEDLSGGTPGRANKNEEMTGYAGEEPFQHSITEMIIKNKSFANIGELAQVSGSLPWAFMERKDLVNMADRFTIYGHKLEAEGYVEQPGGWSEVLRSYPATSWYRSDSWGETGVWVWDHEARLANGTYIMSIYGQEGEGIAASVHLADDTWTSFTPGLTPGKNQGVIYGIVEIGGGGPGSTPDKKLELKLKNQSESGVCHFDYIRLDPLSSVPGRVNINTASSEVLQALPGIDEDIAQCIIDNRPYGNKDGYGRGRGDLVSGDVLGSTDSEKWSRFGPLSNLITVRSDVYQIIVTAQLIKNGRVLAERRIRTVTER